MHACSLIHTHAHAHARIIHTSVKLCVHVFIRMYMHEFIYIHLQIHTYYMRDTHKFNVDAHAQAHTHTRTNLRAHMYRKLGYPVFCPFQVRNGGVFSLPLTLLDDILFREAQKQTKENVKRRLHNEVRAERLRSRQAHLCKKRLCADSPAPREGSGGPTTAGAAEL